MRICRMIVSRGMEQVDLSDEMQQRDGCEPEPAQQVPPPPPAGSPSRRGQHAPPDTLDVTTHSMTRLMRLIK